MQCELNNLSIHYERIGEGRPIILLHGWTTNLDYTMIECEPLFANRSGWQRIYVDLPGHGKTLGAEWVKGMDQFLEVILAFIEAVIPGQRFALGGFSAGGLLARGITHRLADRIDGLLLVVPLIIAADARRDRPPATVLSVEPELAQMATPDELTMLPMLVQQTRPVLELLRRAAPPGGRGGDPAYLAAIRADPQRYGFSFDVDALTTPFPAPTLILCGRQDALVGYRDAWRILENYPRSTYAVLDFTGHLLWAEQPGLYEALIGEWLDRVETYQV